MSVIFIGEKVIKAARKEHRCQICGGVAVVAGGCKAKEHDISRCVNGRWKA